MGVATPPGSNGNRKARKAAEKRSPFEQAVARHQAGDLARAERLYRKALADDPTDVGSLNNLGLIAFQGRRLEEAAELFQRAARFKPDYADAWANLGGVRRDLGRYDEAVDSLRKALALSPHDVLTRTNLGLVLRDLGHRTEARSQLAAAVALDPAAVQARYNLAGLLLEDGEVEAAAAAYSEVLRQRPDLAAVWVDRGLAQENAGRLDAAEADYRQALQLAPGHLAGLYNLGGAMLKRGRLEEAEALYRQALGVQPDLLPARVNLALVELKLGRTGSALEHYQLALSQEPDHAEALCGLGNTLERLGRPEEAIEAYRRGTRAHPDSPELFRAMAAVLQERGRLEEAIEAGAQAARLDPSSIAIWAQLAFAKKRAADWQGLQACQDAVAECLAAGTGAATPFSVLVLDLDAKAQLTAARRWAEGLQAGRTRLPARPPHSRERIRVGYVSADYRRHATAYLATGLFEAHDRNRFEVVAYDISSPDDSEERRRLEAAFDRFVNLNRLSHAEAAQRIHADEIDILVDLKGYTAGARTEIFAHRPAAIQVNYLGYPGTMGGDFIDYVLVDPFIAPTAAAADFSEALVQLPVSYQPNMRRPIAAEPDTRADHGLPEDAFVFCSFNHVYKITPAVFDVWMRLLRGAPGAVLWLLDCNAPATANLKREAAARGVEPERLVFAPPLASAEHLARHRHADLFLDTLPVCAHTTGSDALWAGLPLVCCVGETFVSRVSGSLLTALGLPELITEGLEDYEALALRLAHDRAALAALKGRLEQARVTSTLFDTAAATRHVETAFELMWRRRLSGEPPGPIIVDGSPVAGAPPTG